MSPHDLSPALFRPPTVLLVEDRRASRSATGRLLRMLSYEVGRARNGEHALGLVRHHPELFDLVLTNVLLPDQDGGELVKRLRVERPGIRLAWIAEYVPIGRAATLIAAHPEVPVIRKPFGFRELRDALLPLVGPARPAIPLQGGLRFPRRRARKALR
jgi:CheY-like chemotaxis protein